MKNRFILILLLLAFSATIRFWKLNQIPTGVNKEELEVSLFVSTFINGVTVNPFIIRLLSIILGTLDVLLVYFALQIMKTKFYFAFAGSILLAILPWHIQLSRTSLISIIIFSTALLIQILINKQFLRFVGVFNLVLSSLILFLFVITLMLNQTTIKMSVNQQRELASKQGHIKLAPVFSNKLIETYRLQEKNFFEKLDIGNYFFKGHPRERGGATESKKLYLVMLPILLLGGLKLERKQWLIILIWILADTALSQFWNLKGLNEGVLWLFPIIFLIVSGISYFYKRELQIAIWVIIFFEFCFFTDQYFLIPK